MRSCTVTSTASITVALAQPADKTAARTEKLKSLQVSEKNGFIANIAPYVASIIVVVTVINIIDKGQFVYLQNCGLSREFQPLAARVFAPVHSLSPNFLISSLYRARCRLFSSPAVNSPNGWSTSCPQSTLTRTRPNPISFAHINSDAFRLSLLANLRPCSFYPYHSSLHSTLV